MADILHVLDCYKGGVRTHLDTVAATLPRHAHTLVLLAGRNDEPPPGRYAQVVRIPFSRRQPWTWYPAARRLARLPGDVCHAHSTFGAWTMALAKLRLPTLYTPHAHFAMIPVRGLKRVAQRALVRFERAILPRGTVLVACGSDERDLLQALYPRHRLELVPHGVPPRVAAPAERDIDFLFVGRLEWQKAPERFLELAAQHPAGRFAMVGAGQEEARLRALARERGLGNLEFLGHVADVPAVMARSKAFVLTSRYEVGVPYVVLEAVAAGCRVVVTHPGPGLNDIERGAFPTQAQSSQALADVYASLVPAATPGRGPRTPPSAG